MSVEFKDNSIQVKAELNRATLAWLEEASAEIESQTKQNTKGGQSGLRDKWQHVVDESKGEAQIGNPMELAIWYEFGTGKHAINGDGRKGYWVFVKGSDGSHKSTGKQYTLEEAKRAMAILRSKGLDAYYTDGMEARRPLFKAFESKKSSLKSRLESLLKGMK